MSPLKPTDILSILLKGNARFASGRPAQRNITNDSRSQLVKKQQPQAAILACSDSRVVPEFIFDVALGDIFVIRTAGNLADTLVLESLEYGINHLNIRLLIVLGHTLCGAITEAVKIADITSKNSHIANKLKPAIDTAHQYDNNIITGTVLANIHNTVDTLSANLDLYEDEKANRVHVQGALYRLEDGLVELVKKNKKL